jgi:hypothetical protein
MVLPYSSVAQESQASKEAFFFAKTNQKTLANYRFCPSSAYANEDKFLLLFSKRSAFLPLLSWLHRWLL